MIKRIVMMELRPGTEDSFIDIFNLVKTQIRMQSGCQGLELLNSTDNQSPCIWTISIWQSVDDLETYRSSALFQKTWQEVKPLFAGKAKAWTLNIIESL